MTKDAGVVLRADGQMVTAYPLSRVPAARTGGPTGRGGGSVMDTRRVVLKRAYLESYTRLMAVLYTCDPYGAGEAAGSPPDEYEVEATALMVNLRGSRTREEVARVVADTVPGTDEPLIDGVFEEWMRFLRATEDHATQGPPSTS